MDIPGVYHKYSPRLDPATFDRSGHHLPQDDAPHRFSVLGESGCQIRYPPRWDSMWHRFQSTMSFRAAVRVEVSFPASKLLHHSTPFTHQTAKRHLKLDTCPDAILLLLLYYSRPRVEWYKGLWALNSSPHRNGYTFLHRCDCRRSENWCHGSSIPFPRQMSPT